MTASARRSAAYADLVAALLDLRDDRQSDAFDQALHSAVEAGEIAPQLARRIRWLQRESVRAVVDHAARVLPPTLLALEDDRAADSGAASGQQQFPDQHDEEGEAGGPTHQAGPGSSRIDLGGHRLLLAGLRPLDEPDPGGEPPGMTP